LKYSESLSKEVLTISKFFDRYQASPNDLILSGIIFNKEIQDKQKAIYIVLKNENLWESFCFPMFTTINLSHKYKNFLLKHLNKKLVRISFSDCENEILKFKLFHFFAKKLKDIWNDSQYKNQDKSITKATFSSQYIIHLVEFLKEYTKYTFQTACIESVATKCRNNQDGPRQCPDNFWFLTSQKPVHKSNENEFITFIEKLITISDLLKQSLDDLLIIEDLLCDKDEYDSS
ncbi:22332_t:CDS:2, partial [Dentiscutata erythropus]